MTNSSNVSCSVRKHKAVRKRTIARFGVKAYPTYFLVSPDGKLIGKQVGYGKGSLLEFVKKNVK